MPTLVGTQSDFSDALNELLELNYDVAEACQAAVDRITNQDYKAKLLEFMSDHKRHATEITLLLKAYNKECATGPSRKQWLIKGKVILAELFNQNSILSAVLTNENDVIKVYTRISARTDQWTDAVDIIKHGLLDEKRHKEWLESVIKD